MPSDLPLPLVPPDADLRGLPFMPLDVVRLMDSDLFALSTGDEFKAGVALWCKSWLQIPAGSLPQDDRVLAHLSGAGAKWRKVKSMALRGWQACSDGRLYHPVVCEKVFEAWERRGDYREVQDNKAERQRRWRAKQKELSDQLRARGITPPKGASLETLERLLATPRDDIVGDDVDAWRDAGRDAVVDGEGVYMRRPVDAGEMRKTETETETEKKEDLTPTESHSERDRSAGADAPPGEPDDLDGDPLLPMPAGSLPVPKPDPRGSRLPGTWTITDELRAWAGENVPGVDIDHHNEQFTDYWRGAAGAKARKADWPATWRKWMRSEHEKLSNRGNGTALALGGAHRGPLPAGSNGRPASKLATAGALALAALRSRDE